MSKLIIHEVEYQSFPTPHLGKLWLFDSETQELTEIEGSSQVVGGSITGTEGIPGKVIIDAQFDEYDETEEAYIEINRMLTYGEGGELLWSFINNDSQGRYNPVGDSLGRVTVNAEEIDGDVETYSIQRLDDEGEVEESYSFMGMQSLEFSLIEGSWHVFVAESTGYLVGADLADGYESYWEIDLYDEATGGVIRDWRMARHGDKVAVMTFWRAPTGTFPQWKYGIDLHILTFEDGDFSNEPSIISRRDVVPHDISGDIELHQMAANSNGFFVMHEAFGEWEENDENVRNVAAYDWEGNELWFRWFKAQGFGVLSLRSITADDTTLCVCVDDGGGIA